MTVVEFSYSKEQLICSECMQTFKKYEYIMKCLECGDYFHSHLCHKQHTLKNHAPRYDEFEFGCEEIPVELYPKWQLATFDIDDLLWRGRHWYLDPVKVREHAEDIMRRVGKIVGWVDMGWDDIFKEAFLEEYPDFKSESEQREDAVFLINDLFRMCFSKFFSVERGHCIGCERNGGKRRKKLVWQNNSTGYGYCKNCFESFDKEELLDMEIGQ